MLAENLSDIFQRWLEFAYDCERHLVKVLHGMSDAATSPELKAVFDQHLEETKTHVNRLDRVFASLNRAPAAETFHAIHSITSEGEKLSKHIDPSPLRDAALIAIANQVEHNEIALYGSLCSLARVLRLGESVRLLEQTLSEEKTADRKLTSLAENSVNREAVDFQNSPHGFVVI
jgi:ferritin-like metal-binding protein YciE